MRFDWGLFIGVGLLVAVALLNLYSAVHDTSNSQRFDQQVVWMVIGLVCFFLLTALDYHALYRLVWPALAVILLSLIAIRLFSDPFKGAARWLHFGGIRIQPSELAKIVVILAIARLFHDNRGTDSKVTESLPLLAAVILPVFMVAAQPDLGTASLLGLIILSVSLLMVSKLWPVVGTMVVMLASFPLLWDRMHTYQKNRILAFLDPSSDPTGTGWHAQQSIYAVGSGKISGKGYLNATQNQFNFLPEHWTDFPFSVWAEEWGFVGSLALLALFVALIFWCIQVGLRARDRFGCAICLGVAAMIFWHVVVNIAMVLGLAPVVGVTLPLISYGGSSVVTFFMAFGLVSSVSLRRNAH